MSGGGANLPAQPQGAYNYTGMPNADKGALGGIAGFNTNPAAGYNSAGATAGSSDLMAAGQRMLPWANQVMQTAFDPQNALYNRMFQQNQDTTGVNASRSGIASTPYGAGIADQADKNFNIDWQNQQLGRQAQGAGAASGLLGAGGNAIQQGTGIGQSVAGFNNQALQQQIQDYLMYMQGGTGATNAATSQYGAESSAQMQNQGMQNQSTAGLGQLAGSLLPMLFM